MEEQFDPDEIIINYDEEENQENIAKEQTESVEAKNSDIIIAKEEVKIDANIPSTIIQNSTIESSPMKTVVEHKFTLEESKRLRSQIQLKMIYLEHLYTFSQNFANDIIMIFKKLNEVLIRKTTNTLNQNKNLLQFFKDINVAYTNFSQSLIKANTNNLANQIADQIVSNDINTMIEKTQETIAHNFSGFTSSLESNLISKGPFLRVKEFFNRLSEITRQLNDNLNKLEKMKEKYKKNFNSKYAKLFQDIMQENLTEMENDLTNSVINKMDFFLVEVDILHMYNKTLYQIGSLLANFKVRASDLRQIVLDYVTMVKEIVEIYLNENRKIFSDGMVIDFAAIQKFYNSINKENLEINFCVNKVINEPEAILEINKILNNLQSDLSKYVLIDAPLITDPGRYDVSNYYNLDAFIEFLQSLTPKTVNEAQDLTVFKLQIKRDPGFMKSWRDCYLVATVQDNLLLMDEIQPKKLIEIFEVAKIKIKLRESSKNPYRFLIRQTTKGLIFNSNKTAEIDALTPTNYEEITKLIESKHIVKTDESIVKTQPNQEDETNINNIIKTSTDNVVAAIKHANEDN